MEDNPKVRKHRERMQQMHKDFFALLKWQRKKMLAMINEEPEKIDGDVEQLKKDLEEEATKQEKVFQSKYGGDKEEEKPEPKEEPAAAGSCPMGFGKEGGVCPVDHSAMAKAFTHMSVEDKKKEGFIHKLYEKDDTQ
jgi:hypothetical protein